MLTSGDADRRHCSGNFRMTKNVVRAGGLLHPVRLKWGESVNPVDSFGNTPTLVGVHSNRETVPADSTGNTQPTNVILFICANFQFYAAKPVRDCFSGKAL